MSDPVFRTRIGFCARCGEDHDVDVFVLHTAPPNEPPATHWATCPRTGEPILVTVTTQEGAAA